MNVLVSIYQGNPFWGYPLVDSHPDDQSSGNLVSTSRSVEETSFNFGTGSFGATLKECFRTFLFTPPRNVISLSKSH